MRILHTVFAICATQLSSQVKAGLTAKPEPLTPHFTQQLLSLFCPGAYCYTLNPKHFTLLSWCLFHYTGYLPT